MAGDMGERSHALPSDGARPGARAKAFNSAMATLGIAIVDTLAAQAAPDTFVRDRFELAPAPEALKAHRRWAESWLDGLEDKTPYQIKRVKDFE